MVLNSTGEMRNIVCQPPGASLPEKQLIVELVNGIYIIHRIYSIAGVSFEDVIAYETIVSVK